MPTSDSSIANRIRELASFLAGSDALRVRIERGNDELMVSRARRGVTAAAVALEHPVVAEARRRPVEAVKADLVGIFRLSRPAPVEGELLDEDRELAFIEALGMRNPVRSLGAGRIVSIAAADGAAVDYGQPLFLLDRG